MTKYIVEIYHVDNMYKDASPEERLDNNDADAESRDSAWASIAGTLSHLNAEIKQVSSGKHYGTPG